MLLLFVEFVGYLMFQAFGDSLHSKFENLLNNGSLGRIARAGDISEAKERVDGGDYEKNDVLIQLWELYNHCVSQLIVSAWRRARLQAPNISKFTYSEKTRVPLYQELREVNRLFKDQRLIRQWTFGFNEAGSVEEYLRSSLT